MKYFTRINFVLALVFLFYKFTYFGSWFFLDLLFGSNITVPAASLLQLFSVPICKGDFICAPTMPVYFLTVMFILLVYLVLSYFNKKSFDQNKRTSRFVLFLTAAIFLFNVGSFIPVYQSLIQSYNNRLGLFKQDLSQKYDYFSTLGFSVNTPADWVSSNADTTGPVILIPQKILGDPHSGLTISASGTLPSSVSTSIHEILSGNYKNRCVGGEFKEIKFSGRSALECVSNDSYESLRVVHITDFSGLPNWNKNNFIYYILSQPHLNLTPLYNKVLDTLTFEVLNSSTSTNTTTQNQNIVQPSVAETPGMSEYDDTAFGFSFWYPSTWKVVLKQDSIELYDSQGRDTRLGIQKNTLPDGKLLLLGNACGPAEGCANLIYYFDANTHMWMMQYPNGRSLAEDGTTIAPGTTKPADVSINTMGGLHMLNGNIRFGLGTVIPLSAHNFLMVTASPGGLGGGEHNFQDYLAKTIVAADPLIAPRAGINEQLSTIQAERNAYAPVSTSGQ